MFWNAMEIFVNILEFGSIIIFLVNTVKQRTSNITTLIFRKFVSYHYAIAKFVLSIFDEF